jgi:hypothetical protein
MSGSFYTRALWIRTKRNIFETRMGKADIFGRYLPDSKFGGIGFENVKTLQDRVRLRHKTRGRYWRFRNLQAMHRLNFDRRRYGPS